MCHSDQARMGQGTVVILLLQNSQSQRRDLRFISSLCVQGHYRFAEALFYMGELERAFKANDAAIDMCSNDDKMVLHEQRMKFIEEVTKPNSKSPS